MDLGISRVWWFWRGFRLRDFEVQVSGVCGEKGG